MFTSTAVCVFLCIFLALFYDNTISRKEKNRRKRKIERERIDLSSYCASDRSRAELSTLCSTYPSICEKAFADGARERCVRKVYSRGESTNAFVHIFRIRNFWDSCDISRGRLIEAELPNIFFFYNTVRSL